MEVTDIRYKCSIFRTLSRREPNGDRNFRMAWERCEEMGRIPIWVTIEEMVAIKKIYQKSSDLTENTRIVHNVDHVIPLEGDRVSGLHVLGNLQIIPACFNKIKENYIDLSNLRG